jgi:hypothetical protein
MARKPRIEYVGATHDVMARGNQCRPIYADRDDRKRWRRTLEEQFAESARLEKPIRANLKGLGYGF